MKQTNILLKSLKTVLFLIALSLLILIQGSETAYGQSTTPDSTFYTAKQDSNCLQCLISQSKKDRKIKAFERNAERCDSLQKLDKRSIFLLNESLEAQRKLSSDLAFSLQKARKTKKIALIGGSVGGFLIGWFIKSKIP